VEPEPVPFVDTHHHLWDLSQHRYGWLEGDGLADTTAWIGDYSSIRRSYLVEDYLSDAADGGLVKSVHIEAVWGEDPVAETRWVQEVADRSGFPHGIVAFCDLRSENAGLELDMHCESPRVRGIRMTQLEGLLSDPAFHRGFSALARRGLSYDINVRWSRADLGLDLARAFPNVAILVGNMANPASLGAEEFASWRRGMRMLAQAPNVAIKICGLGMTDHTWTVERIRPWVLEAISIFGPERCMFGTNWPVDRLYSSYRDLVDAYRAITAAFSLGERLQLFVRNAEKFYRI
jgi:predicted TIM-barrel fold metal-dependent hydrolase